MFLPNRKKAPANTEKMHRIEIHSVDEARGSAGADESRLRHFDFKTFIAEYGMRGVLGRRKPFSAPSNARNVYGFTISFPSRRLYISTESTFSAERHSTMTTSTGTNGCMFGQH